jgi:hypothetical protein
VFYKKAFLKNYDTMLDIFERIKENPGPLGQFADYGEGILFSQD